MGQYTGGELGRSDASVDATNPDVPSVGVPLPGKQENEQTRNNIMNLLMLLAPAASGVGGRAAESGAEALLERPPVSAGAADALGGRAGLASDISQWTHLQPHGAPPSLTGIDASPLVEGAMPDPMFRPPITRGPGSLLRGQRVSALPPAPSAPPMSMTPSSPLSVGDFADGLSGPPYWAQPTLPPGGPPALGAGPSPRLLGPGGGPGAMARSGPGMMADAGDASVLAPPGPSPVAPRAGMGDDDPLLLQILRNRASPSGALGAGADDALGLASGPLPPRGGSGAPGDGLPPWLIPAGVGAGAAAGGAGLLLGRQSTTEPWTRKPVNMPPADGADPLSLLMDFPPLADATGGAASKPKPKKPKAAPAAEDDLPPSDASPSAIAGMTPGQRRNTGVYTWPRPSDGVGMFGYPGVRDDEPAPGRSGRRGR